MSSYSFEWEQDRRRRVLCVHGKLSADAADHLLNGLVNLGSRSLVIDLTDVESVDDDVVIVLEQIRSRLGPSRMDVVDRDRS